MISEFIYTGNFNDPFNEFFIEKVYKISKKVAEIDQVRFTQDFLFKMSSDPSKIPSFIGPSISLAIFKVGSHVNLLQMLDATASFQKRPYEIQDQPDGSKVLVEIEDLDDEID